MGNFGPIICFENFHNILHDKRDQEVHTNHMNHMNQIMNHIFLKKFSFGPMGHFAPKND